MNGYELLWNEAVLRDILRTIVIGILAVGTSAFLIDQHHRHRIGKGKRWKNT